MPRKANTTTTISSSASKPSTTSKQRTNTTKSSIKTTTKSAKPPAVLSPRSNTIHPSKNALTIHSSDTSDNESDQETSSSDQDELEGTRREVETPVKRRPNTKSSPTKKDANEKSKGKKAAVGGSERDADVRKGRQREIQQQEEAVGRPSMPEEQVEAFLASYDLEVQARLQRLVSQLEITVRSSQVRIKSTINRIPRAVRELAVGEFVDKYDADIRKFMGHAPTKKAEEGRKEWETMRGLNAQGKRNINSNDDGEEEGDGRKGTDRKGKAARRDNQASVSTSSKVKGKEATSVARKGLKSNASVARSKSQSSKPPIVASSSGARPPSSSTFAPRLPANHPVPSKSRIALASNSRSAPSEVIDVYDENRRKIGRIVNGVFTPTMDQDEGDEEEDDASNSIYEEAPEGNREDVTNNRTSVSNHRRVVSNTNGKSRTASSSAASSSSRPSSTTDRYPFPSKNDDDDDDDNDNDNELPDVAALTQETLNKETARMALSSSTSSLGGSSKNKFSAPGSNGMVRNKSSSSSRPPVAGGGATGFKGKTNGKKQRASFISKSGLEVDLDTASPEDVEGLSPRSKREVTEAVVRHREAELSRWGKD